MLAVATWGPAVGAVTIDTVFVGNAGNPDDVRYTQPFGGVGYAYRIGRTEVTNAQYVEFLNAVARDDVNGLFNTRMSGDSRGGIVRSGTAPNFSYSVKPAVPGEGLGGAEYAYENKPVVFVSWYDSLRFANWLHNGQPEGAQDATTTEDGAYVLSGSTVASLRQSGARWFLPNEDEWYKAAYHKNDGVTGNYWSYPLSERQVPLNYSPIQDNAHSANYWLTGYATGDVNYPLMDVGAYSLADSPYGTFDQAGNVFEQMEPSVATPAPSISRGGSWGSNLEFLSAYNRGFFTGIDEGFPSHGFRVARGLAGDFDEDGDADAIDFLVWQRDFGAKYDSSDLQAWREEFGTIGPTVSVLSGVPEPASRSLALFSLAALLRFVPGRPHRVRPISS